MIDATSLRASVSVATHALRAGRRRDAVRRAIASAARAGDADLLLALFERRDVPAGVSVDVVAEAAALGHVHAVMLLLSLAGSPDHVEAALASAIHAGNAAVVVALLRSADRPALDRDLDGVLPLTAAVRHADVVDVLLQGGAPADARDDEALVEASRLGLLDSARLLLSRGANVHARRELPLLLAVRNGHADLLFVLLARSRPDPARRARLLMEAVRWTPDESYDRTARVLIDFGARPEPAELDAPRRLAASLGRPLAA